MVHAPLLGENETEMLPLAEPVYSVNAALVLLRSYVCENLAYGRSVLEVCIDAANARSIVVVEDIGLMAVLPCLISPSPHHFSLFFTCERHPQTAATSMSCYKWLPFRNMVSSSSCSLLYRYPFLLTALPLD